MTKTSVRFISFPKTEPPPSFAAELAGVFRRHEAEIATTVLKKGLTSPAGTEHAGGRLYSPSAANSRGAQFDTSVGRAPFQFTLGAGQVIAGWDQGLVGMKVGGTRTLIIPSALAYGSVGAGGGLIPPNAALVFTVDLLAVQ